MFSKYITPVSFDAIRDEKQKYIAKIDSGFWKCVKPGNRIILTDGEREMPIEITNISYFSNFDDAWFKHGDELVPSHICNIVTARDALTYFRAVYQDTAAETCGVVVFGVVQTKS